MSGEYVYTSRCLRLQGRYYIKCYIGEIDHCPIREFAVKKAPSSESRSIFCLHLIHLHGPVRSSTGIKGLTGESIVLLMYTLLVTLYDRLAAGSTFSLTGINSIVLDLQATGHNVLLPQVCTACLNVKPEGVQPNDRFSTKAS